MKKRVAILGGSFNPPHVAHIEICRYLFDANMCEEVWVVPCFNHPFGKVLASYDDRLNMCKFAFQEFDKRVKTLDTERVLGGTSHTVRTLQYLKKQEPDLDFSLVIGGDVAEEKQKWRDFDQIQEMVHIIEIPRGVDSPITDISSTKIRTMIKHGESFHNYVSTHVAVYIVTHGLYH